MATAGKSGKKAQSKPKGQPPAARRRRDPVADAKPGEGSKVDALPESRRRTIRELAFDFLKHPVEWLDHPNPQFGGRTPNEMIAAGEEDKVRNLFECAEFGLS